VECATDDTATAQLLQAVDHADTRQAVHVERAFLATLGSGCSLPVGAHVDDDVLRAFLADPAQGRFVRRVVSLPADPLQEASRLARAMQRELDDG
jgi:hydroxymethylbilane synthase